MTTPAPIILAAHGAGPGSDANANVQAVAARLQARLGRPVSAAFNLGDPHFSQALDRLGARDPVVLPLMMAEGYFATRRLPANILKNAVSRPPRFRIAPVLGAAPNLIDTIRRAVADRLGTLAPRDAALLLIGHGTNRHARSGGTADALAEALQQRFPGLRTATGFIDQDPTIETAANSLLDPANPARRLLVLPMLLGGGGHALEDVPQRVGGAFSNGSPPPVDILPPLGALPGMDDLAEDLIRQTDSRLPLRIATRPSRLARWQAERVALRFAVVGVPTEITEIRSAGDRDQSTPIESFVGPGVFTDDLEHALLTDDAARRADLAVHSYKDLPLEPNPALAIPAVLPRGAVAEALVARDSLTLDQLPPGALVGSSSPRRRAQLLALRPDLRCGPIRGNVPDRVRQVDEGAFDATVLAVAGLQRLGLTRRITHTLALDQITPEAAQGAIAVQCRADDWLAHALSRRIDRPSVHRVVDAERAIAAAIEAASTHNLSAGVSIRPIRPARAGERPNPAYTIDLALIHPDGPVHRRSCTLNDLSVATQQAVIAEALSPSPAEQPA